MKAQAILNIKELIHEKADTSKELYEKEVDKLENKYKTDWLSDHMTAYESDKLHELKENYEKWTKVCEDFDNHEF